MFEFVHSWLALGALGASVPIIIHFLFRRRFKIVRWAAMEFLLASLRKNFRRLRMQNLLLLLLRVLMMLLIAFALARPRLAESGLLNMIGAESRQVILVLDDSMSMSCRDGSDTAFARAQKMALDILSPAGGLRAGDSVSLIMMSDVARAVIKEPTTDISIVRREISSAHAGWG